ncbi:MAG: hypothetical protein QNJ51_09775 [Calothrix sp. MO_167.B12]|nr:hypothetical protein [Calothrix sp. MO_167.B12]
MQHSVKNIKQIASWCWVLAIISTFGFITLGQLAQLYWAMVIFLVLFIISDIIVLIVKQEIGRQNHQTEENIQQSPQAAKMYEDLWVLFKNLQQYLETDSINTSELDGFINKLFNRHQGYIKASEWLADKQRLKDLAMDASDIALNKHPFQYWDIRNLFISREKRENKLYQNVYYCLTWIKSSFYAGDYLPTSDLKFKISRNSKKRVILALESFLIEEHQLLEGLPEDSRNELEIYFDKLIEEIKK